MDWPKVKPTDLHLEMPMGLVRPMVTRLVMAKQKEMHLPMPMEKHWEMVMHLAKPMDLDWVRRSVMVKPKDWRMDWHWER